MLNKKLNLKKNCILNNKGVTLVELVVTMLVSSIICLAIVGFISTATNSYRKTNADTTIQLEAQVASNVINDIIISAKSCTYQEVTLGGNIHNLLTVVNGDYYYLVLLDVTTDKLRLKKIYKDDISLNAEGTIDIYTTLTSANLV